MHGGKMKLSEDEVKLIVASIEMMTRLVRDDSNLSLLEKKKTFDVADDIRRKFHNAYFADPRGVIVDPDGFVAH